MLQFYAYDFVTALANLAIAHANAAAVGNHDESDRDEKSIISSKDCRVPLSCLNAALTECEKIKLKDSAKLLKRLTQKYSGETETWERLANDSSAAIERMLDELDGLVFVHVPPEVSEFYINDCLFGVAVAKKFPKVTGDIQEAGRCFASGRNTATVFHLMRVMEASVKFLGRRLKIDLVTRKNWGVILDQVDKAIKGLPVRVSRQRARRDRLAEASAHLRMVKDAWRNDVMHPKESYSEEEAERVFRNVKDFMVHVATKL
jgi:HEPN domain-containing protein